MISRRPPQTFVAAATISRASYATLAMALANQSIDATAATHVDHVLETVRLIDGHNDLPSEICECFVIAAMVDASVSTANPPRNTQDRRQKAVKSRPAWTAPGMRGTLQHLQYDIFRTHLETPGVEDAYVTFALNPSGSIDAGRCMRSRRLRISSALSVPPLHDTSGAKASHPNGVVSA